MNRLSTKRRLLVPEVVQTSGMDCGPAALACLLQGYGIPANYGRLREACQTDVDGTSIDDLEAVAGQMGLEAEQVMMPVDHLLLPEAEALPAIVVTRLPGGFTHFVLVWRRHGPLVQVMDPAVGRRWLGARQFLDDVYVHTQLMAARDWHAWAASDGLGRPLERRLRALGLRGARGLVAGATGAADWRALARLDAVARLGELLVAGGVRRGREARNLVRALLDRGEDARPGQPEVVPAAYWSARPASAAAGRAEEVLVRGAVLLRVRGRYPKTSAGTPAPERNRNVPAAAAPGLAAVLGEPASRPARTLLRLVGGTGLLGLVVLALGLVLAAGGGVLEALLLRAVLDAGRDLVLPAQRLAAAGAFLACAAAILLLETGVAAGLLRLGRRLEGRLRVAFLEKLRRLPERYFGSRPTSDTAERAHAVHQVRVLPRLTGDFVRSAVALAITVAAVAWVDPASAPLAAAAALLAAGVPLALVPLLQGLDLRARTHAGALSLFYFDALLGLAAIRAHGAEQAVRREHESLLVEWGRASRRLLRWTVALEGLQALTGFGLAGWLLVRHAGQVADAGGALLLAYWALSLPGLGEEITRLVRQYPGHRNVTLRLLEPLGTPEETEQDTAPPPDRLLDAPSPGRGVAVRCEGVTVQAAGRTILEDVSLTIPAGSQVAVVGASGAGKSTLLGLFLGWHRAAAGQLLIDGAPLDAAGRDRLRAETAWVDPAVQLWNRPLAQNLLYGAPDEDPGLVRQALHPADLLEVLRRLPQGLQTPLGEGGGLLSGGEGQRVRLGRAMLRPEARLVLLDEPFRGLDRPKRRELLRRARSLWRGATLLCVTHDVGETRQFERVLVIDGGRVVEDGPPVVLALDPGSRYRALLDAEESVREGLWASPSWRRLRLEAGRLVEGESPCVPRAAERNGAVAVAGPAAPSGSGREGGR
jgi:ATP-binding cassette subfamily B protein